MTRTIRNGLLLATAALAGCGGGGGGGNNVVGGVTPVADCSAAGQKQFVDDTMRDIYYWVDELPTLNPNDFATPEDLLEAMRFTTLDIFSNIQDQATSNAFFSNSQFIGLGVGLMMDANDRLRVAQAFADSPAAQAGLDRGYEITSIDGRTVASIVASGENPLNQFGASEVGVTITLTFADLAGTQMTAQITKAIVTIEPVSATAVLANGGRQTGYLAFRNFVQPSFDALETAFAEFAMAGVEDLVVDLRYNGGGLVAVANELASLIGGVTTVGQVLSKRTHNAANNFRDETTTFTNPTNSLGLSRVVFITTAATASASELVMNALAPFLQVQSVGARSFGKPVGSYLFDFCDKTLSPISFSLRNANDFGGFFDGLPVDCTVEDDLGNALGDPQEASLQEALTLLATDQCSVQPQPRKLAAWQAAEKQRSAIRQLSGWQQLVNAR